MRLLFLCSNCLVLTSTLCAKMPQDEIHVYLSRHNIKEFQDFNLGPEQVSLWEETEKEPLVSSAEKLEDGWKNLT